MLHSRKTFGMVLASGVAFWSALTFQAAAYAERRLSIETSAKLAKAVYDIVDTPLYTVRLSEQCWQMKREADQRKIACKYFHRLWQRRSPENFATLFVFRSTGGVSAAVLEHKTSGDVVLAFAGSDQLVDWLVANQGILRPRGKTLKGLQTVAAGALGIAEKLPQLKKRNGRFINLREVSVVGHSLGGYLTQLVTALQPVRHGASFNGPGLYRPVEKQQDEIAILLGSRAEHHSKRYASQRMDNHVRQLDPIGRFGRHFGTVHLYKGQAKTAHSIDAFLRDLQDRKIKPYDTRPAELR